jgi:hypothetical protein
MMKRLLTSIVLLACGLVQAQTVWRCGPDGRSYSDSPCADGRTVDVSDSRDAEAVAAAREVAALDKRLAEQWAAERERREGEQRARNGSGLAAIAAPESLRPDEPAIWLRPVKLKKAAKRGFADARTSRATARAFRRVAD